MRVPLAGELGRCGATHTAASDHGLRRRLGHADPADSPREHWIDIMVKGGLLCTPELARIIAYEAPERFQELDDWGGDFDRDERGGFRQILSDGARYPRACGRGADTGPIIVEVLMEQCRQVTAHGPGSVEFLPQSMVVDLAVQDGRVQGAWGLGRHDDEPCGGGPRGAGHGRGGRVVRHQRLPRGQTGDGYAMALRAGLLTN